MVEPDVQAQQKAVGEYRQPSAGGGTAAMGLRLEPDRALDRQTGGLGALEYSVAGSTFAQPLPTARPR